MQKAHSVHCSPSVARYPSLLRNLSLRQPNGIRAVATTVNNTRARPRLVQPPAVNSAAPEALSTTRQKGSSCAFFPNDRAQKSEVAEDTPEEGNVVRALYGFQKHVLNYSIVKEFLVRKGGFEPPRLSAPPPQDGVSASSTTSARNTAENYSRRKMHRCLGQAACLIEEKNHI